MKECVRAAIERPDNRAAAKPLQTTANDNGRCDECRSPSIKILYRLVFAAMLIHRFAILNDDPKKGFIASRGKGLKNGKSIRTYILTKTKDHLQDLRDIRDSMDQF